MSFDQYSGPYIRPGYEEQRIEDEETDTRSGWQNEEQRSEEYSKTYTWFGWQNEEQRPEELCDEEQRPTDEHLRRLYGPVDESELLARSVKLGEVMRQREETTRLANREEHRAWLASQGLPIQDRSPSPRAGVGGLLSPPSSPIPRLHQLPHAQPQSPSQTASIPTAGIAVSWAPQASVQPLTSISSPADDFRLSPRPPSPDVSLHPGPTGTALPRHRTEPLRFPDSPTLRKELDEWEASFLPPRTNLSPKETENPVSQDSLEQEAPSLEAGEMAPTSFSYRRAVSPPSPITKRSTVSQRTTSRGLKQSFRRGQGVAGGRGRVLKPSNISQGISTL
ncbi:MAG: hypothetical protein Q9170_006518 [Blastenia crenularia]